MTIDIHFASIMFLLSRRVELAIIWPCKVMLKIWTKVKVTWSEKVMLHISRSISSAWTQLRWPMSPLVKMSPMSKFRDVCTFYRYCYSYQLLEVSGSRSVGVAMTSIQTFSDVRSLDVTWWPGLERPGSENFTCAEMMYDQVCQKWRREAPLVLWPTGKKLQGEALNSPLYKATAKTLLSEVIQKKTLPS